MLPRFPEVEGALREGRLCLSAVGELARVLTPENRAKVLPRFFGCSSREAREVAAALVPLAQAPWRDVVTSLLQPLPVAAPSTACACPGERPQAAAAPQPVALRAHEVAPTHPARALPRDDAEPLDADLRRLHVTVSRRLLDKLDRARDGLSHTLPCATTEQVLEAALDLLLERQARAKGAGEAATANPGAAARLRRPARHPATPGRPLGLAPDDAPGGEAGVTASSDRPRPT